MGLYEWIKRRDKQLADQIAGSPLYFHLSPTRSSLYKKLLPQLKIHLHGRCLDAGAGRTAYQILLKEQVSEYIAVDMQSHNELDAVGSVLQLPFAESVFDSIFCSQVLEHVPNPEQAMHELFRVLKPGGTALITVPHLAYLHNEPNDYCRFTHHGLRAFLSRCGFEVVDTLPAGGLLSFLGHIPSVLLKAAFASVPGIGLLLLRLNALYSKAVVWLDERVERRKIYALNYIAIAKKPELQANE